MLDELVLILHALLERHRALTLENRQLLEQLRLLVCERATLLHQVCPPSCPVAFASKCKGEKGGIPEFLVQTMFFMLVNEASFCRDALKIAFLINLLTGNVEKWVVPYLQEHSNILSDLGAFVEEVKQQFGWDEDEDVEEEEEEEENDDDDDDDYFYDDDDVDDDFDYDDYGDAGDECKEDN